MTKEYKAVVKQLKKEHKRKIKSLETHYYEAVRYVQVTEISIIVIIIIHSTLFADCAFYFVEKGKRKI